EPRVPPGEPSERGAGAPGAPRDPRPRPLPRPRPAARRGHGRGSRHRAPPRCARLLHGDGHLRRGRRGPAADAPGRSLMTTRRGARPLLFLAVVALTGTTILARSGAGGPPGDAVDMRGRRVAISARAARVVSLAPSMTEIVYALGAGGRLVGVATYCDFPPAAKTRPRIGGIYTPNLEAILDLRPDLVLATSEGNREEHIRALEDLHLPVFVVRPVDFASVLESIARVGEVLDRAAEARRLVADMQ